MNPLRILIATTLLLAYHPAYSSVSDKGAEAFDSGNYEVAHAEWLMLAEQGHANAQFGLGIMYGSGTGVLQNDKTAFKWHALAAKQGYAYSQYNLGRMYELGRGISQCYATASYWFTLAAEQGLVDAQSKLGNVYEFGYNDAEKDNAFADLDPCIYNAPQQNHKTALKWYTLAAGQGDSDAKVGLQRMQKRSEDIQREATIAANFDKGWNAYQSGDYKTALSEWIPLAEQGHAFAQYSLGHLYEFGTGTPQNYKAAFKWHTLAAEQGVNDAIYRLGNMYNEGKGVPQDYKAAVKWFTLAAKGGDAHSQYNLAVKYDNGQGVPENDKTAVKWYTLAAEQGLVS